MITPSKAKSVSATIEAAHRRRELAKDREKYAEYAGESRSCGYEVQTFEEWRGEVSRVDDRIEELISASRYCPHAHLDA